jgi:hypothetical protein
MRWTAFLLAAVLASGCASMKKKSAEKEEEGDEVKMALADVPVAVRDTLTREAGGAKIESVDKEEKNGQTIYETDVMSGGKNWEIKVDASGKLISKTEDNEAEEKAGEKKKGEKEEEDDDKNEKKK